MEMTLQRQDGVVLHFLKEVPAYCVLFVVFSLMVAVYLSTNDPFIQRLLDGSMGALFTALVSNRQKQPTVSANKIETGDISTGAENAEEK